MEVFRKIFWLLLLLTLQVSSFPISTVPGSLGGSCDYSTYPLRGCEDSTLTCDQTTLECQCKDGYLNLVGSFGLKECIWQKDYLGSCTSSLACTKISGICDHLGRSPEVHSGSRGRETLYLSWGNCKCAKGTYYDLEKEKCLTQKVIGSFCSFDSDCKAKPNAYCNSTSEKCSCLTGFAHDEKSDECKKSQKAEIEGKIDDIFNHRERLLTDLRTQQYNSRQNFPQIEFKRDPAVMSYRILVRAILFILFIVKAIHWIGARIDKKNLARASEMSASRERVINPEDDNSSA